MTLLSLDNQIAPHPITPFSNNNGYTYLFNGQTESAKLASKFKEGIPLSFNDCHQSIQDFSLAIKFAPELAKEAYYQRGIVYSMVEYLVVLQTCTFILIPSFLLL